MARHWMDRVKKTDKKYGTHFAIVGETLIKLRALGISSSDNQKFMMEVAAAKEEDVESICNRWLKSIKKSTP